MHHNAKDMTGFVTGKLTVLEYVGPLDRFVWWRCECECGNTLNVRGMALRRGQKSCGCHVNVTHGKSNTRLHRIWSAMKTRCSNPNARNWQHYGGRGIRVCEEWKNDFEAFRDWSHGNGYADDLSIDRIDVNGNYEPSNCRWADRPTQARNTRTVKLNEEKAAAIRAAYSTGDYTLQRLGTEFGVSLHTIHGVVTGRAWR